MNVGSLFSGVGGIDLGLERAGMRVVWQVECDPYARAVLRKHWPEVPCYDDVRNVGAANLAPVDLVCGGFPCQDISSAGKRAGIDGAKSGLWREYARIIRALRPRYVLVENVAALLNRGLERVLGDLAACGYDAEWDCFPASAFGAPHRRDRLFIVAHHIRNERRLQPESRAERSNSAFAWHDGAQRFLAHPERLRQLQPQGIQQDERGRSRDGSEDVPDTGRVGQSGSRVFVHSGDLQTNSQGQASDALNVRLGGQWQPEPDVGRVAHGVPSRMDRLACLGNAVVPQVAEYIGRLILAHAEAS